VLTNYTNAPWSTGVDYRGRARRLANQPLLASFSVVENPPQVFGSASAPNAILRGARTRADMLVGFMQLIYLDPSFDPLRTTNRREGERSFRRVISSNSASPSISPEVK
jgi:hypothetical protein